MDSRSRKVMLMLVAAAAIAVAPLSAAVSPQAKPAAKIDGVWNMAVTGPDGSTLNVKATFKTNGKKLTGTLVGPQGEVALDGEYADGKIAFGISIDGQEGPMKVGFAGNLKEDGSLAGMATGPFGEVPWTAKKTD